VFKFDPEDHADLSVAEGGGFPQPELLPWLIFLDPQAM